MFAALVLAAAASSADAAPIAALAATESDVRAAIVRAVEARVALPHAAVEVTVEDVRIRGGIAGAGLRATPDAGSRAGGPMRFILHAAGAGAPNRASARGSGRRMPSSGCGRATRGRRGRSARARSSAPADVAAVAGDPGRVPLQPLPQADALVGARAAPDHRRGRRDRRRCRHRRAAGPQRRRGGDDDPRRPASSRRAAPPRSRTARSARSSALQIEKRRLRGRVRGAGAVEITP